MMMGHPRSGTEMFERNSSKDIWPFENIPSKLLKISIGLYVLHIYAWKSIVFDVRCQNFHLHRTCRMQIRTALQRCCMNSYAETAIAKQIRSITIRKIERSLSYNKLFCYKIDKAIEVVQISSL